MKAILAAALFWAFPHLAMAQVAVLHIQVTEGEGAVNSVGARTARPLGVEVTDETGKPVAGAAVSFHLPEEGPGGTFGSGLRTDVTVTDTRGRATLHTVQLNHQPGRLAIRIVASKEQARAGMVSFQYIADQVIRAAAASAPKRGPSTLRGPLKWVLFGVVATGGAAAAVWTAGRSRSAASTAANPPTVPPTAAGIAIGSPTITVGKP